jgi:hypothetical protein
MKGDDMAKRGAARSDVNKSEEIRNTVRSGIRRPKEVQAKLAERGIQVSRQMISTIKSKMFARRKARKIESRRAADSNTNGTTAMDLRTLTRFIRSVHDVGGVREARKILNEMEA